MTWHFLIAPGRNRKDILKSICDEVLQRFCFTLVSIFMNQWDVKVGPKMLHMMGQLSNLLLSCVAWINDVKLQLVALFWTVALACQWNSLNNPTHTHNEFPLHNYIYWDEKFGNKKVGFKIKKIWCGVVKIFFPHKKNVCVCGLWKFDLLE